VNKAKVPTKNFPIKRQPGGEVKILLVDNDKTLADSINREFAQAKVHYAADGDEGLTIALEKQFDIIVLDWALPKKDGLSLLKELRKNKILTPVLMLTAEDAVKDVIQSLNSGANDCLNKPSEIYVLIARMKALIRRSRWDLCEEVCYAPFCVDPTISLLIVDEYETARDAMARLISMKLPNLVVHVADGTQNSLEICNNHNIGIVIIDITSKINPCSFIGSISEKCNKPKFIITTASSEKEKLNKLFDMNNTCILRKPIDMGELFTAIKMNVSEIEAEHRLNQP
jgi:DNA-binding response OmpR family regulator